MMFYPMIRYKQGKFLYPAYETDTEKYGFVIGPDWKMKNFSMWINRAGKHIYPRLPKELVLSYLNADDIRKKFDDWIPLKEGKDKQTE